ncbi:MAG: TetR/AcrR family transcriptional regulator [Acidimicrobiia bacterium]
MQKRRADIEQTRDRIVEATVTLHGTVGPARTTVSAIAETAGVQRSTVYRHFPDDASLFRACTSHWLARHPWPDPQRWLGIHEPALRLASALDELYAYFSANQRMLGNSLRDREAMPAFVGASAATRLEAMHTALTAGWGRRGRQRRQLEAAIRHALDFRTWASLDAAGLSPPEAAGLMTDLAVHCAARGRR